MGIAINPFWFSVRLRLTTLAVFKFRETVIKPCSDKGTESVLNGIWS